MVLSLDLAQSARLNKPLPDTSHHIRWAMPLSHSAFAVAMPDNSMLSLDGTGIPVGAKVVIDPERPPQCQQLVAALLDSPRQLLIRQWVEFGGKPYLAPLNRDYPLIEPTEKWTVVGVVCGTHQSWN